MTPEQSAQAPAPAPSIRVEITDETTLHCFKLVFLDTQGREIEIFLHATQLVHLIHQASVALSEWQHRTTTALLARLSRVFPLKRPWYPGDENSAGH